MNNFPLTLLFTLLALVLVLVLAWFAIRLLSHMGNSKLNNNEIQVTHTTPIGAREKLMLVNFKDYTYFLGVTANGITVIDKNPVSKSDAAAQLSSIK